MYDCILGISIRRMILCDCILGTHTVYYRFYSSLLTVELKVVISVNFLHPIVAINGGPIVMMGGFHDSGIQKRIKMCSDIQRSSYTKYWRD